MNDKVHSFACGEAILGDWLKRRALGNQSSGASRTFVVATSEREVMGWLQVITCAPNDTYAAAWLNYREGKRGVRTTLLKSMFGSPNKSTALDICIT